ncbi:MAG: HD domain-containing phosphohydrolase [Bacillota bacterium]
MYRELLGSDEFFKMITENVNDMISLHTPDGKYVYVSPSSKGILGYEPEELVGVNPYDLFHPDSINLIRKTHDTILAETGVTVNTYQIKRKNGDYIWLETSNQAVVDEKSGESTSILCVSRDVTARIEQEILLSKMVEFAEELLIDSEDQVTFQKILENILYISNAKYGAITFLDSASGQFKTVAVAGINESMTKITKLLGMNPVGKVWENYPSQNDSFKGKSVAKFDSLTEATEGVLPKFVSKSIETVLNIGELNVAKIIADGNLYGDISLMMPMGVKLQNEKFVDIYSKQIDLFFTRKIAKEKIAQSEEKFRLLAETVTDVIWVYNTSLNKYTFMSPSVFDLRGISPEEAIEMSLQETLTPKSYKDALKIIDSGTKEFLLDVKNPKTLVFEMQLNKKDGGIINTEISARFRINKEGQVEIVGLTRDIEDRKKIEQEIIHMSHHDQLTGLKNRRFFDNEAFKLNEEKYMPLSLIMIDVNGLKLTNDAFGHKQGDKILEKIAGILSNVCRKEDVVARIGGDEFIILLPQADSIYSNNIIDRINDGISKEKVNNVTLSVSLGYSVKTQVSEDIDEVFKNAEDAMYRHKLSESMSMRSKTIELIMNTLYEKSPREQLHSKRVSKYCEKFAQAMNFHMDDVNHLRTAGLMHDIGKIGVDETLLNKPSTLTGKEWDEIKRHPEIGFRILSSVNEFSEIADFVLAHHERWNGGGYPKGLIGNKIPLQSRMISIVDSYDAMTSERAYMSNLTQDEAIAELKFWAGQQFDPELVKIFVEEVLKK